MTARFDFSPKRGASTWSLAGSVSPFAGEAFQYFINGIRSPLRLPHILQNNGGVRIGWLEACLAIANSNRRRMIEMLVERESCSIEIAAALDIVAQTTK